jgi:hypothetical protein
MKKQIVTLPTPQDLTALKSLKRGEKLATVQEEVQIQDHVITHHRYTHQSVEIKVQTLQNLRKVLKPIFATVQTSIESGEIDALPQLAEIRSFLKELETIEKWVAKKGLDEAQRLQKTELQNRGWEIGSTGDKLDYEQDEEYSTLKKKLKEREELLKRAHRVGKFVDEETGEEIPKVQVRTFATEYVRTYNPPKNKDQK